MKKPWTFLQLFLVSAGILLACELSSSSFTRGRMNTHQSRHYDSELGFSYGVNFERARATGDTNGQTWSVEKLRRAIDELSGSADRCPGLTQIP